MDITVKMEEDKQYFLGRISFTGNDSTRDKVIRREIYMNEGEVFNTEALKMSIKRVNQLGYFKPMEGAPDIRPSETADNKVDVTFKVEEQNRNQFTFGGGVSGLEGTFLNAVVLDHQLPRRRRDLPDLRAERQAHEELLAVGQRALLPRPPDHRRGRPLQAQDHLLQLRQRLRLHAGEHRGEPGDRLPGREVVARLPELHVRGHQALRGGPRATSPIPSTRAPGAINYGPQYDPLLYGDFGKRTREPDHPEPRLQHRRQPLHPARRDAPHGHLHVRRGPARRDGQLLPAQPRGDRLPARAPQDVARHARRGGLHPALRGHRRCCRCTSATSWAARRRCAAIPSARSAPSTRRARALGGNKFALFNAEYYFDVFGPVRALLFFDAGQAYLEGQHFSFDDFRISTGAEVRFIMPVLNVPFRLIYAFNPNRTPYEKLYVPYSTFKFAVGTTF